MTPCPPRDALRAVLSGTPPADPDTLDAHLQAVEPYRHVDVLLFQHGVASTGIATPPQWLAVARRHGAHARLLAVDPRRFPHDIASLGRHAHALATLPPARRPWSPLDPRHALGALRRAELTRPRDTACEQDPHRSP